MEDEKFTFGDIVLGVFIALLIGVTIYTFLNPPDFDYAQDCSGMNAYHANC